MTMMPKTPWRGKVAWMGLLSVLGFSLFVPVHEVVAADTTAILISIQKSLSDITGQIVSVRDEVRNERAVMLKRTNDLETKYTDLSAHVDDLDSAHQYQQLVKDASRITDIERRLEDARLDREKATAQAKSDHESNMVWVRLIFDACLGTLLTSVAGILLHRRQAKKAEDDARADVQRVESKVDAGALKADAAYVKADHFAERERRIEGGQAHQDDRIDALEDKPPAE